VLQGERPMAKDNKSLGIFNLDGIPPAPRGTPQIEVIFDIDANGILNVIAKDKGTNKEHKIRIEAGSGLSKEEIEKMKNEAKANEESDKIKREKIEKLNAAHTLIFQTDKQLQEYGEKISEEKKKPIEDALAALKESHKQQNLESLTKDTETLNQAWMAASEEIYKASQPTEPQADANSDNTTNNDKNDAVSDAEYEEVKK
ncbi:MAG: Hsp70 family protein, partial [Chitinophagaceae bacterium]